MSLTVVGMVLDAIAKQRLTLSAWEQVVLTRMADRAHDDGTNIYPSVDWLMRATGAKRRTVLYAIEALEALKPELLVRKREGRGRGNSGEWLINLDNLKGANGAPFVRPEKVQKTTGKGAKNYRSRVPIYSDNQLLTSHVRSRVLENQKIASGCAAKEPESEVCASPNHGDDAGDRVDDQKILRPAASRRPVHRRPVDGYSADFETAWAKYPRRSGGNSKSAAFRAWQTRLRQGVAPADLIAGVVRYAAFIRAKGDEGTAFVKMAATFFGPDENWREEWVCVVPQQNQRNLFGGNPVRMPLTTDEYYRGQKS